jgi:hypothetical protein
LEAPVPDFTFCYPQPMTYTEGRDAAGRHLGTVRPGDIRDLAEAPDHMWRETTDEDRALAAAEAHEAEEAAEDEHGRSEDESSQPEPDQAAAPQPAPAAEPAA